MTQQQRTALVWGSVVGGVVLVGIIALVLVLSSGRGDSPMSVEDVFSQHDQLRGQRVRVIGLVMLGKDAEGKRVIVGLGDPDSPRLALIRPPLYHNRSVSEGEVLVIEGTVTEGPRGAPHVVWLEGGRVVP